MTIFNTRFWLDSDRNSVGIRSSHRETCQQPFEVYLKRHPAVLDCCIYETGAGDGDSGVEFRLSLKLLWLSLNMCLWTVRDREVNEWDGNAKNKPRQWGWRFDTDSFCPDVNFLWGHKRGCFRLPYFSQELLEFQIVTVDGRVALREVERSGSRCDFDARREVEEAPDVSREYDYTYIRKSGEVQRVKARVHHDRYIRRRKWTPIIKTYDYIDVRFSEGIGERVDTWKGGCTGCGYELRDGETMEQALRRMEVERVF